MKSQSLVLTALILLAPGGAWAQSGELEPPAVVTPPSLVLVAPRPAMITNPRWGQPPRLIYPEAALSGNVEGAVVMACRVRGDGRFQDCEVVSETPSGYGFAAAAMEGSRTARVHPRTVDGLAVDARATWTARFRLPSPMPGPQ
ncbi:MAG: TonB family protein [Alphaproteobacteria bacterium]|nr:TonB family protein [Alphaproteobacteria bacterium]